MSPASGASTTFPRILPDAAVMDWFNQKRRAATGNDFAPLYLQQVVAIGCALRNKDDLQDLVGRRSRRSRARADSPVLRRHRAADAATRVVERRRLRPARAQSSRADPRHHCRQILGLGRPGPRIQVQQLPRPLSHAASRSDGRAGDVPAARQRGTRRDGEAVRLSGQARHGRQPGRSGSRSRQCSRTCATTANAT